MFDLWHSFMFFALPFVMGARRQRLLRLRVWVILFASSVATWVYASIMFYVFIDLIAAAAVMKQPKTDWQRAIGACYIIMGTMTLGFSIAEFLALQNYLSAVSPRSVLTPVYVAVGWLQLILLFAWGDSCGGRIVLKTFRSFHSRSINLASAGSRGSNS